MDGIYLASLLIFILLVVASCGTMLVYPRLPARHREEDTNATIRQVANIFVVMTSLVFGLMVNSARSSYESLDDNLHTYATELILFDRTMRDLLPDPQEGRRRLIAYIQRALAHPPPTTDPLLRGDNVSESLLNDVGDALKAANPRSEQQLLELQDAERQFQQIVRQRWVIVEQADDSIPIPLVAMLVAWLVVIFASYGYRAPNNSVVIGMFAISAFLISASLCLIMDMNVPFSGLIQVSDRPLRSVLAEIQH